jgi:hypothetical protein
MKRQVAVYFGDWLTLMEEAFEGLDDREFTEFEDKICREITTSRRSRKTRRKERIHGTVCIDEQGHQDVF